jgi:putative Mg2+ transporter-C (MgtC) family protein
MGIVTPAATVVDLGLRLAMAMLAGALIGMNRELAGKPAGLRTHSLVSLGAAATTIVGLSLSADPSAASRTMQGLMAGVGFIGGGVILHDTRGVHGLTTAATIWIVAAIGMASGSGLWFVTLIVMFLALFVLVAGESIDRRLRARTKDRMLTRRR